MAKLKLKSSQWIVDEHDNAIIGEGRMEILDNIEKTGSINQKTWTPLSFTPTAKKAPGFLLKARNFWKNTGF